MNRLSRYFFFGWFVLASWTATAVAQELPEWLRQATAGNPGTPGTYDKKTAAVTLLSEERVVIESDGKFITTERRAMKLLSREGRERAVARAVYRTDGGRVRQLRAWLIRPSSTTKSYDNAIDLAAVNDDVYNEVRIKAISAVDDAEPGAVFGFEAVTEEISPFAQLEWMFQDNLPTVLSRRIVELPQGWSATSFTFNHPRLDPQVSGQTYTWELRNLPAIDEEPAMPRLSHLVPRVALTLAPPVHKKNTAITTFQNWQEISRWLSGLQDPQAQPGAALSAKAQELTRQAPSELEKIQAIARYVQGIRYTSIQTGLGRGGGYRPHSASEVFAKSYGDCKDKMTLMRAMLQSVGIVSYPVAIYSGDASYVNQTWPSPQQFNHTIIAIKVADVIDSAMTIRHPHVGRLLVFDPTDPDTPIGDLPRDEQDSLGLLVAGEAGALLRMPTTAASLNHVTRSTYVTLDGAGSIKGVLREESMGQTATSIRGLMRQQSATDFVREIERWIRHSIADAAITGVQHADKWNDGRFVLTAEFSAARYGQLMSNKLLVFKPAVLNRRDWAPPVESTRQHPFVMRAQVHTDIVRLKLPPAFKIDEIPDPVKVDTSFGSYSTRFNVTGDELVFERNLVLQSMTIPPDQYTSVRSFFQKITAAEQAAVVLIKN